LHALSEAERAGLIASLDEAERDIDEGRTYNGDQLRQAVRWRLAHAALEIQRP